jgi:hypothetical protein
MLHRTPLYFIVLHCTSLYFIVLPFALHAPQANDRVFKHELSKLVDLDVWTRAKEASKAELGSRQAGAARGAAGRLQPSGPARCGGMLTAAGIAVKQLLSCLAGFCLPLHCDFPLLQEGQAS